MPDFRMFYEYSMTLRELLQSVDAEAYASIPLFEELLNTKPEYGSSNRIKVKVLNGEIAVSARYQSPGSLWSAKESGSSDQISANFLPFLLIIPNYCVSLQPK